MLVVTLVGRRPICCGTRQVGKRRGRGDAISKKALGATSLGSLSLEEVSRTCEPHRARPVLVSRIDAPILDPLRAVDEGSSFFNPIDWAKDRVLRVVAVAVTVQLHVVRQVAGDVLESAGHVICNSLAGLDEDRRRS